MRAVVAVLRGGPSSEYEVSLKTGASVLAALDREKYEPRDLFISRGGQWHLHGVPVSAEKALFGTNVAFNALHGEFGEDGGVQRLLERLGVPYTGSGPTASARAFNKHLTKEAARPLGVKLAHSIVVDRGDAEALAQRIFRTFPHPAIVKPVAAGSSVGAGIAHSFHGLVCALEAAFAVSPQTLVEEYIKGREATVGVIDDFRNERTYSLLPAEIRLPPTSAFYDHDAKYGGQSVIVAPGNFPHETKAELQRLAKAVHEGLGMRHFSRSDFIVSTRGIYFLEVDSISDLAEDSEFAHMLSAVGTSMPQFVEHMVGLARRGGRE